METTAFRIEGEWTPDGVAMEILDEFPHSIHFDYSLHRDQWYKIPEKVYYCPDCESEARMKRLWAREHVDAKPGAAPNGGTATSDDKDDRNR